MASAIAAGEHPLHVGWASTDISPTAPVAIIGQKYKRLSKGVLDPLTATVLALETKNETGQSVDQAIMVSCDLCFIRKATRDEVCQSIAASLPDFDSSKLFMSATHTHTAPPQLTGGFRGLYDVSSDEGVLSADEYRASIVKRISAAAVKAWTSRKPGGLSWGLGQAVIGHNRRSVYFDGHTQMYGSTNKKDFDRIEGYEDHGLPLLFLWDADKKLTGIIVNLSCPSQETEHLLQTSADFWHETRQEIAKRHSKDVFVLPQCSAAGDISPHFLYRKAAELEMFKRKGISRRQDIANRIADAIDGVLPYAGDDHIKSSIVLQHTVRKLPIPKPANVQPTFYLTDDPTEVDIHFLRIGDVALATNPYELYLDFGLRMQARSPAMMTLTVQLCGGVCGYLPTSEAVHRGGYSAVQFITGPQGGDLLVEETVKEWNTFWKSPEAKF